VIERFVGKLVGDELALDSLDLSLVHDRPLTVDAVRLGREHRAKILASRLAAAEARRLARQIERFVRKLVRKISFDLIGLGFTHWSLLNIRLPESRI